MAIRPDEPIPRLVQHPELVKLAERLMAEEQASCPTCHEEGMNPRHFRSFIKNGVLYQTPCGGRSRVFDPTIPAFVGSSHCTCDYCF